MTPYAVMRHRLNRLEKVMNLIELEMLALKADMDAWAMDHPDAPTEDECEIEDTPAPDTFDVVQTAHVVVHDDDDAHSSDDDYAAADDDPDFIPETGRS